MILILTHSNKGLPLQLHKSGVLLKGEHSPLALCIYFLIMILGDLTEVPSNVVLMVVCDHHLFQPHTFVLTFVARLKSGGRG